MSFRILIEVFVFPSNSLGLHRNEGSSPKFIKHLIRTLMHMVIFSLLVLYRNIRFLNTLK